MSSADVPRAVSNLGGWLDDRFHGAGAVRNLMNKVFPDQWTFMLGEIALWTFVIELLTGTYLALFFEPSLGQVVYHGSYIKLNGVTMSEAYQSTLRISFDVRGGLLIRQIHHWSADLFMAAMSAHLLRHFFLGSYRKPRDITWLIGIVIYAAALVEGLFGYSLPDDQLSGAGLRIFEGVLQGIPVIGTYMAFFLFGGQYPGTAIEPRMYIAHVLLLPGLILALVTAHVFLTFHHKHTAMPALGNSERKIRGQTFYPYFALKGTAWFFFIFGALAVLGTFAQINPVWLYGPYSPLAISSASQPDWYLGILEGALRVMPSWEINFLGHTVTLSVLIPFALPLGLLLGGAAIWPFFERWVTRDNAEHQINDRPRNVPVRTGIGVAAVVFYGVLWAEGANDVIADKLQIPLYTVTWIARVLVIAGPVVAFIVTRRVCLALQRKDTETLERGVETGIIRQLPDGGFTEVREPVSDEARAVLSAKPAVRALPAADVRGTPAPDGTGIVGKLRIRAHAAFTETAATATEADGHADDRKHQPADSPGELPASETHREASSAPDLNRSA
ncbi:MAG TPA: cytochrome bc complex cytochrome b subunit [Streptosporangiaceae bacterium]